MALALQPSTQSINGAGMSGPAALPIFGDAYLADTQHLTLEEHGAYFKLLLCAWRSTPARLPADDKRIATMLGISAGKWGKLKPAVMAFWTLTESGWEQKRLTKERKFVDEKIAKNTSAANARWNDKPLKTKEPANADAHAGELPLTPTHLEKKDESVRTLSGECEAVVAEWNAQAKAAGMPTVTTLSTSRKAKLKARLAEHDRAKFTEAIRKLCASTFARNGTWATFDFLLTPNGFVKTIEGNYDDRPNTGTNLQPRNSAGQPTERLTAGLRILSDFLPTEPSYR